MKQGDKVSWTHVSQRGRTMSMSLKEGTVEKIEGKVATIRTKSNRLVEVSVGRLRAVGQPSQLGEFVEAMREAHR